MRLCISVSMCVPRHLFMQVPPGWGDKGELSPLTLVSGRARPHPAGGYMGGSRPLAFFTVVPAPTHTHSHTHPPRLGGSASDHPPTLSDHVVPGRRAAPRNFYETTRNHPPYQAGVRPPRSEETCPTTHPPKSATSYLTYRVHLGKRTEPREGRRRMAEHVCSNKPWDSTVL